MTHSFRLSIYLDFYRFHRFILEETSVHQNIKTEFMQTVNLLTMSGNWESQDQTLNFVTLYCLSNITYKEIFKNILCFLEIRIKIFFWWLILARSVGSQSFRIWIYHPFKLYYVGVDPGVVTSQRTRNSQ